MENDEFVFVSLSDESYAKAIGQLRLAVGAALQPFCMYGMQDLVPGAQQQIVKLAEDFSLRVRGDLDKPISLNYVLRK